jgi:predicted ATP-grasp superfamily ATP-dependent carboligase
MKILIYEAVTAGLLDADSSTALWHEAEMMVKAAVRDFSDLHNVHVKVPQKTPCPVAADGDSIEHVFMHPGLDGVDKALIIAPERHGLLTKLSKACDLRGIDRLGSSLSAIDITSNKYQTYTVLTRAAIPTPKTWRANEPIPPSPQGYVTKPQDGCGSEEVQHRDTLDQVQRDLHRDPTLLAQAFIEGQPASALAFFKPAGVRVLSVNRQRLDWQTDGRADFQGVETGAYADYGPSIEPWLQKIHHAIPGLYGIVGVDFVITPEGPVVIEINPRLTSAYPDLRTYLGYNPATLWFTEQAPC